ncbi:MAG: hypothetical protein ACRDE7_02095, partial [Sphingobacterium sp.]
NIEPGVDQLLPELIEIYNDIHHNPELSMKEFRTAEIAASYLTKYNFQVVIHKIVILGIIFPSLRILSDPKLV